MIRLLSSSLVAVVSLSCAHAQPGADATSSLVAAERAFAADAGVRQVNETFLRVLAADGILFRPGPVNGRNSLAQRAMAATLDLRWAPIYAETAADGLLGFTTGPSTFGERGQPPSATGFFVSLWRRTDDVWQLELDCGIEGPIPAPPATVAALLRTRASPRAFTNVGTSLRAVEESLITDYRANFAAVADHDVRVYRNGFAPATTRAAGLTLVQRDSAIVFAPANAVMATSADLGYVYGVTNPKAEAPRGYLRIYRRAADGNWKIAVDWHN